MPATKYPILTLSVAAAALVLENRMVNQDGNYTPAAAAGFGLTTEDAPAIGSQVGVDMLGTSIATAGAAVAKDALLEVGATGQLVTLAAGVAVARAMQSAGAAGDKIEVFLLPK